MKFWQVVISTTVLIVTTNANAALVGRLAATDGGTDYQAYYDTEANLTWLADANNSRTTGYDADGRMDWSDANNWATGLNVGGVTGWRLPETIDIGNDGATYINLYQGVDYGYNITSHSELSNMYFNVLGNTSDYDINGVRLNCPLPSSCLTNTGPFSNLQATAYWSGTESAINTDNAWLFFMGFGIQAIGTQEDNGIYAWAVHSGDVSAVPVPAAVWLFGSGLIGLAGLAKRKTYKS